jgi:hypothetical protein
MPVGLPHAGAAWRYNTEIMFQKLFLTNHRRLQTGRWRSMKVYYGITVTFPKLQIA